MRFVPFVLLTACTGGGFDPSIGIGPEPSWGSGPVTFEALSTDLEAGGVDFTDTLGASDQAWFHPFEDQYALYHHPALSSWMLLDLTDGSHQPICGSDEVTPETVGWVTTPFWVDGDELTLLGDGWLTRCTLGSEADGGGLIETITVDWGPDEATLFGPDGFATSDGRFALDGTFSPFDWGESSIVGVILTTDKSALQVITRGQGDGGWGVTAWEIGREGAPEQLAGPAVSQIATTDVYLMYDWAALVNNEVFHYGSDTLFAHGIGYDEDPRPVRDGSGAFFLSGSYTWGFRPAGTTDTVHFTDIDLSGFLQQPTPDGSVVSFGNVDTETQGLQILDATGERTFDHVIDYPCGDCTTDDDTHLAVYQNGVCLVSREYDGSRPLGDEHGLSEPLPLVNNGGVVHLFDCATGEGLHTPFVNRSVLVDATVGTGYFWHPNTPLITAVYQGLDQAHMVASWYATLDGLVPLHSHAYRLLPPSFYRPMQPALVWTEQGLQLGVP